jgi:hypothetical protein
MDIDLKPNNGIGKKLKRGERHFLPGDNRSAVCKWIPDKGKKEKERALRSHLESILRLCSGSTRKAVSLVGESSGIHAQSSIWSMPATAAARPVSS